MDGDTWQEVDYFPDQRQQKALAKKFVFKDFKDSLDFVNKVGALAELAGHHPDINFGWGYAQVWLTTHSSHGITEKDHKLSRQIDELFLKTSKI